MHTDVRVLRRASSRSTFRTRLFPICRNAACLRLGWWFSIQLFLVKGQVAVHKQKLSLIVLSIAFLVLALVATRSNSLQPYSAVSAAPGLPLPQTRNFQ